MAKLTKEDYNKLDGSKFQELKNLVEATLDDYLKATVRNMKQPGTRCRKNMLSVIALAKEIRKEVLESRQ